MADAKKIAGGLGKVSKALLADGEEAVTAAQRAEAGRKAAELIKSQTPVKASEALGQLMEKRMKRVTTTQADRTRVGGGNIGGAPFSALSEADPNYAGKVWGVMDEGTAARLKNLTDPETVWTTMLGSANQLKTNPVVFDKLKRQFIESMKQGNLSPELEAKINHNLALTFGEGAQIRDPKIWRQADTFDKRAALADLMMGQGIPPKKGGVALGGEKSGKGVIFKPTDTLKRETEPYLLHSEHGGDVPTFAAGPRLFTLEKESVYRPDLHPGFPTLLTGKDLEVNMIPTPTEIFLPDWHREFKKKKPERFQGPWSPEIVQRRKSGSYELKGAEGPGYYDLALGLEGEGLPSQALNDEYIRHLLREGFKDGGSVDIDAADARLSAAIEKRMAKGGAVDIEASDARLADAINARMADGGKVVKGATKVFKKLFNDDVLPMTERDANLAKFLEPSKIQQRLYHGTTATEGGKGTEAIRRIKASKEGSLGSGVYLTPRTAHASGYSGIPNDDAIAAMRNSPYSQDMADQFMADRASGNLRKGQVGGNMLPVHAQIKNPLILEGTHGDPAAEALIKLGMDEASAIRMVERAYEEKGNIGKQIQARAQAAGYDGLAQYRDGELSEVVSYNPNAVKSAIGNQGTYDTNLPDLNKADGGKIVKGAGKVFKKLFNNDVLPTAQRDANLQKFLAPSAEKRRMYHGSKEPNIKEFKTRKEMTDESMMTGHYADERDAVFLSPEPQFTKHFSQEGYTDTHQAPTTYPVHVQIEKPFDFDNPEHLGKVKETYLDMYHNPDSDLYDPYMLPSERSMAIHTFNKRVDNLPNDENNWARIENKDFQEVLKDLGFDSFYTRERGTKNLGVYEPNRIKSAIGNRGTYDLGDSDINKADGGLLHMADAGKVVGGMGKVFRKLLADDVVNGMRVRKDIPNTSSIGASLSDYSTHGLQEVPMSAFETVGKPRYRNAQERERTQELARQIQQNKELNPLIVVKDAEGHYILEGGHRFDALRELDIDSFPALVVHDLESLGTVAKADGGKVVKGAGKVFKKLFEDAPTESKIIQPPNIIIPSKLSNVKEAVRQSKGEYGARRVERAADEIPNLDRMYKEDALAEVFTGDNARAMVTMKPHDFERYANELQKRMTVGPKMAELAKQGDIDKMTVPTDEYIKHLQRLQGGFDDVPYLNLFKDEVGIPDAPRVIGHEGRHRNRALAERGDKSALVKIDPRGDLREGLPRRTQEEFIEALKEELERSNRLVIPEPEPYFRRPAVELPDIYAGGGLAMADGGKLVKGGAKVLKKLFADDVLPVAEREANLAKFLEPSAVKERMYHGTTANINQFKPQTGDAVFLTPDPKFASKFAWNDMLFTASPQDGGFINPGANVMPVHVQVKNPFDYENPKHIRSVLSNLDSRDKKAFKKSASEGSWQEIEKHIGTIQDTGFDSVFLKEMGRKNLAVFEPNQIKSDIGNRGTYDVNEPEITKAEGGGAFKKIQFMDKGGITTSAGTFSPEELGVNPSDIGMSDKRWNKIKSNASELYGEGKEQLEKEYRQLGYKGGKKDFAIRVGSQLLGGGSDLVNLGLMGLDFVQSAIPAISKPESVLDTAGTGDRIPKFKLASDEPWLGSEHFIRKFKEAELLGNKEFPLTEIAAGFVAPAAAANALRKSKQAYKGAKALMDTPKKRRGGLTAMTR